MGVIYTGKFLSISHEKENNIFVQKWDSSLSLIEDFKHEMLVYVKFYKEYKPAFALWFQNNFKLLLNDDLHLWIEKHVNIPCLEYGNEKCAFIVSQDVLTYISVIDSFDKLESCIVPEHFVNEMDARSWLNEPIASFDKPFSKSKILFEGTDENGDMILKISSENIKQTFKTISKLIDEENNIELFNSKEKLLTKRERDILRLIYRGEKHQTIAEELFLSIHTVRTHLKNSKQKLNFEKESDFPLFLKPYYLR